MSRSFRKTPVFWYTAAKSEKKDKKRWHRAFRRGFKQYGDKRSDIRYYSNPWGMAKDGKRYSLRMSKDFMRK